MSFNSLADQRALAEALANPPEPAPAQRKTQLEKALAVIMASATPQTPSQAREALIKDCMEAKLNKAQAVQLGDGNADAKEAQEAPRPNATMIRSEMEKTAGVLCMPSITMSFLPNIERLRNSGSALPRGVAGMSKRHAELRYANVSVDRSGPHAALPMRRPTGPPPHNCRLLAPARRVDSLSAGLGGDAVEGDRMPKFLAKPAELKCRACKGTGFPAVRQPAQPGRKIYPARCERCGGKGWVEGRRPRRSFVLRA